MVNQHVMLGAVACRGGALLLVDGVSGWAGMCRRLQNQGADGKQQDADCNLAQSAIPRPKSNSCTLAHAPPAFSVTRETDALPRSRRAPPAVTRPPR